MYSLWNIDVVDYQTPLYVSSFCVSAQQWTSYIWYSVLGYQISVLFRVCLK